MRTVNSACLEEYKGGLTLEWNTKQYLPQSKKVLFQDGVSAHYGLVCIRANQLVLDDERHLGVATGEVYVEHPEGFFTAEYLEFDWVCKTGKALQVCANAYGIVFHAEGLDITPDCWDVHQVKIELEPHAVFRIESSEGFLIAKKSAKLKHPHFFLFGKHIASLSSLRVSLDSRIKGFGVPKIVIGQRGNIGVVQESVFALGEHLLMRVELEKYIHQPFSGEEVLAWTFNSVSKASGEICPSNELKEPFDTSYFDRVAMRNIDDENLTMQAKNFILSLSSAQKRSAQGRVEDRDEIDKKFDFAGESSGSEPGHSYFFQARFQDIKDEVVTHFQKRSLIRGTLSSRKFRLFAPLDLRLRADGATFLQKQGAYAWIRTQAGLMCPINENLKLGLGASLGQDCGKRLFEFDRPFSLNTLTGRVDFEKKKYAIHYLMKYDLERRRCFDHEVAVYLSSGAFEPFFIWRQSPFSYFFGVKMRASTAMRTYRKKK